MDRPDATTFAWQDAADAVSDLACVWPLVGDPRGSLTDGTEPPRILIRTPLVLPAPLPGQEATQWIDGLPDRLGIEVVVLLQAGHAALGLWADGDLAEHKAFDRYVVRGNGKAQPTHLATKGKSRYGSRLRLQNWRRLLEEVAERLTAWSDEYGPFDRVFKSCPERTWPELFTQDLPFEQHDPRVRSIPMDVHRPNFAELRRIRWALEHGQIELRPN